MIEFFNSIKDRIGMDANNFYPALITLFSLIFAALLKIYSSFSNNIKNKIWNLRYKEESDFFYIVVLVKELLFTFVQAFFLVNLISALDWLLTYLGVPISKRETKVFIVLFVWVVFCLGVGYLILKSKKVRERCLVLGDKQLVLLLPYWIYNIIMVLILYQIRVDVLDYILTAIMIVGEIYGLYIFRGRYIKYDYSSAKIFTEDGYEIECNDISKMKRKGSALIISDINRQVRIKYGSINKVEYYGAERVILKDTKSACGEAVHRWKPQENFYRLFHAVTFGVYPHHRFGKMSSDSYDRCMHIVCSDTSVGLVKRSRGVKEAWRIHKKTFSAI